MVDQPLYVSHPHFVGPRSFVLYPQKVTIDTQAIFQILGHAVRSPANHRRVVGTLLGYTNEDNSEVNVKAAFMMPLTETQYEISIPTGYQSEMFNAIRKAHPDYVVIGWYSTSSNISLLDSFIQNYFTEESSMFRYPPVFVHVNAEDNMEVKAYVTSQLFYGSTRNPDDCNCMFTPIEHSIEFSEIDKPALAARTERADPDLYGLTSTISESIAEILTQIDLVAAKVAEIRRSKPTEATEKLGKYLFKMLSNSPVLEPSSKTNINDPRSAMFNAHMRDLVSIINLTNSIKSQVQLSTEVATRLN